MIFHPFLKLPLYRLLISLSLLGIILPSCSKDADPTVIKVSSTPLSGTPSTIPGGGTSTPGGGTTTPGGGTTTPGTVSSTGDGGVAIGAEGTIIFTLKGTKYTLTHNLPSYLATAVSINLFGLSATTITGTAANNPEKNIQFLLGTFDSGTGVFDVIQATISFADGSSYSTETVPNGKINFNTFTVNSNVATTKGTFDMIMVNNKDATDKIKVAGSFNLK